MIGDGGSISEQAFSAFRVLLYVGPIAVYALWLGLVNSQAVPKLVKARDDFMVMTIAFWPFALEPVVGLVRAGHGGVAMAATGLMLLLFLRLLPAKHSGWVTYNLSPRRGRMWADRSLRSLEWSYRWVERTAIVTDKGLSIELRSVPVLRNVTFHIRHTRAKPPAADVAALRAEMSRRLEREGGLPSVAGCCLMMGGVLLLILPLWMLSHHSAAIAEVMTRILVS